MCIQYFLQELTEAMAEKERLGDVLKAKGVNAKVQPLWLQKNTLLQ